MASLLAEILDGEVMQPIRERVAKERAAAQAAKQPDPKAEAAAGLQREAELKAKLEENARAIAATQERLRRAEAKALHDRYSELSRAERDAELRKGIARLEKKAAKRAAKGAS